jgi:alpha-1,3-rhamnosyl/mannosyltransferase
VVAVSEETRIAIAKHYAVNASDITVVPNAVDANFFTKVSDADNKRTANKYTLPSDYILFLGTLEPRKNLVRLLEAYSQLPSELTSRYPLVLAGNPGWKNKEILNKINELIANGFNVHKIGFVEDKDLPALFDLARLFVFPSIHEGFGLPILEAMAAGTPVVTSNLPPMNRIAKNVAMFVEPEQVGSIKNAIERVLSSPRIASSMSNRGQQMAQRYTWDNSAQTMLELIERVTAK